MEIQLQVATPSNNDKDVPDNEPKSSKWSKQVVVGLLVDDGVPDRGHRFNIFDEDFTTIGVACDSHPRFDIVCVMDMTGGFEAHADTAQ